MVFGPALDCEREESILQDHNLKNLYLAPVLQPVSHFVTSKTKISRKQLKVFCIRDRSCRDKLSCRGRRDPHGHSEFKTRDAHGQREHKPSITPKQSRREKILDYLILEVNQ